MNGDWILHLLHNVETQILWISILQALSLNCEYHYNLENNGPTGTIQHST